ncbi:MAG: hypothetical protein AB7S26_27265 [Sandaracinaceae bacterium]
MLTNLLRPWILARLVSGGAALALAIVGVWIAFRVLRHWRVGRTSEGQLALERRAELVAAVVQVALWIAVADAALTVLAADRLSTSISGAMCAYGVLDASPFGFVALGLSIASALACALWLVLHRLDLRLRTPVLTRRKFIGLFALAPLLFADLVATARWALDLDMHVVASCCSTGLDAAIAGTDAAHGIDPSSAAWTGGISALVAALSAAFVWRRPGRLTALFATLATSVAAVLAMPAILAYVAPHAYGTPRHLCPFCLLHADVFGIGWPLFAAVFGAMATGLGLAVVELQRGVSRDPIAIAALERRLGGYAAALWGTALVIATIPVVRFAVVSGGASLFGGS